MEMITKINNGKLKFVKKGLDPIYLDQGLFLLTAQWNILKIINILINRPKPKKVF